MSKLIHLVAMLKQPQSLRALGSEIQLDPKTVARHCKELSCAGWMRLSEEGGRLRPVAVVPPPIEEVLANEVAMAIEMAHFKGEETTKMSFEWICAPSVDFHYDCQTKFLINPETGQSLRYDIYSKEYKWAIEYHGDQHFVLTKLYSSKDQLRERQKRDLMKVGLSQNHGIRLFVVTKHDLSLQKLLPMVPLGVPKRDIDPSGPLIQRLEKIGRECAGSDDWDRE